ncbi:MAG: HpcH/HpaI aldolase/citrate lyase family protein [Lysobacter sp.]
MRSKLFVPGTRPELFAKALGSAADAISFDLEDSVPPDCKLQARVQVAGCLRSEAAQESNKILIVRTNPVGSPCFEADVLALVGTGVDMINLPKVESAADVLAAVAVLERAESDAGLIQPIPLLVNIETPRGLRYAAELAGAHPRVAGLQLGLADLFEPLGIDRRDPANLHATLFAVRMAAGEAGVFACDGAFADLQDAPGFRAEALMARRLGYIGKSCIHPSQVPLANEVFNASAAEVAAAQRIVDAARAAAADGRSAFVVDGQMVDPPFIRRAEAILASARDLTVGLDSKPS